MRKISIATVGESTTATLEGQSHLQFASTAKSSPHRSDSSGSTTRSVPGPAIAHASEHDTGHPIVDVESCAANLSVPGMRIDKRRKLLLIDGRELHVSSNEFAVLSLLASDPGRVFSCKEILDAVWDGSSRASFSDVRQLIYLVRKRIETDPARPRRVCTATGFGYYIAAAEIHASIAPGG